MNCVSRALVRVRSVLFGPPEPEQGAASRASAATTALPAPTSPSPRAPSPEVWAAILASARRRRANLPWAPSDVPAISSEDITSTLVGIYLLLPVVRQRARAAARVAEEACR